VLPEPGDAEADGAADGDLEAEEGEEGAGASGPPATLGRRERKALHPAVRKLCGGRGGAADEEGVKAMLRSIGRWVRVGGWVGGWVQEWVLVWCYERDTDIERAVVHMCEGRAGECRRARGQDAGDRSCVLETDCQDGMMALTTPMLPARALTVVPS